MLKAHSILAGKLEKLKAPKLPGFLASRLQAMTYELSAMSYLPDTRNQVTTRNPACPVEFFEENSEANSTGEPFY